MILRVLGDLFDHVDIFTLYKVFVLVYSLCLMKSFEAFSILVKNIYFGLLIIGVSYLVFAWCY